MTMFRVMRALRDVEPDDFHFPTAAALAYQPVSAMRRGATDPVMDMHLA